MILPVGRDSSWEASVPLHHGSHIRFGCVEFVFCIVDYPAAFEERSYTRLHERKNSPSELDDRRFGTRRDEEETTQRTKNEDLSSKLTSILSALSSESRMGDESSSLTSPSPSPIDTTRATEGEELDGENRSVRESKNVSDDETFLMCSEESNALCDFVETEEESMEL